MKNRDVLLPSDALADLAPVLRVTPLVEDFCRFGGSWRAPHAAGAGAAFHIVTKGTCSVEQDDQPTLQLRQGDVLLLPRADRHVVYDGDGRHALRQISVTDGPSIRVKRTEGPVATELICGRLLYGADAESLLVAALPRAIVVHVGEMRSPAFSIDLILALRDEIAAERLGSAAIAVDLASALFMMLLRAHIEQDPPLRGMLALLVARPTRRAAAAMLHDPARAWTLEDLASEAAVSLSTLVRSFRRISGMAPLGFLRELRLNLARSRIERSTAGLGRIAFEVGYGSEAALSRALKRRYGTRPGSLRKAAHLPQD